MSAVWRAILVSFMPFWALSVFAAESGDPSLQIFDVTKVTCQSGAQPDFHRVFLPGAVVQMKKDVVEAFAKANSDRDSVILRYPIAQEGLDSSTPPPCKGGDTLLIELKKHIDVRKDVAEQN